MTTLIVILITIVIKSTIKRLQAMLSLDKTLPVNSVWCLSMTKPLSNVLQYSATSISMEDILIL